MKKTRFLARENGNGTRTGDIYLYDEIGPWTLGAAAFAQELERLRAEGVVGLDIYINSPGGDVFEGVAIYNQIRRFPGTKTVHIDGLAASIASVISLAGDRIVCAPNAMIMIHDPWCFAMGSAPELRERADRLDKIRDVMVATYAERTGQAPDDIRTWMADETWMTAPEAKERGFAHEINTAGTDSEKALASVAEFELLERYRKTPTPLRARHVPPPADRRPEPDAASVTEIPMKSIAKHLGLSENATESEIQNALFARDAKASADAASLERVLGLTGKTSPSEALGAVTAWKQAAEQVPGLSQRVQALEAEKIETQVVALVDGAVQAGKLAPAQREFALSMGRKDVTMLKGFVESAPVIPSAAAPAKPPAAQGSVLSLSIEDQAVARQLGISEKDFLAQKQNAASA